MIPIFHCVLLRYFGYMTNSIQRLSRKKYHIILENIFYQWTFNQPNLKIETIIYTNRFKYNCDQYLINCMCNVNKHYSALSLSLLNSKKIDFLL